LDVYFREDIRNILRATYVASEGSTALLNEVLKDPELQSVPLVKLLHVYKHGFAHALGAIGLAFGLDPMPAAPGQPLYGGGDELKHTLPPGDSELFWPSPHQLPNVPSPTESLPGDNGDSELGELDLGRFLWTKAQHERRR
jgi:hypothetical protein